MLRLFLRRLWAAVLILASGYMWGQRGPKRSRAWKVGTVACILLILMALAVLYLR